MTLNQGHTVIIMGLKYLSYLLFGIILILPFSSSTLVNGVVQDGTLTWDSDRPVGLELSYEFVSVEGQDVTFAGETPLAGKRFNLTLVDSPPTDFDEMYDGSYPDWLELTYDGSPLPSSSFSSFDIQLLYLFFIPTEVNFNNGTEWSMFVFLDQYNPEGFRTSMVRDAQSGFEYVASWENIPQENETNKMIEVITDKNNGGTNWITFQEWGPETNNYFQLRFTGESTYPEDDEEDEDIPVSMDWHQIITEGTILAWNLTEINQTGDYVMGEHVLKTGDNLQFGFRTAPPDSVESWMPEDEPPNWLQLFINSVNVPLEEVGEGGQILLVLALPVQFEFKNGTIVDHKLFFDLFFGADDSYTDYSLTTEEDKYYNVTFREEWSDDDELHWTEYNILSSITTGVALEFNVRGTTGDMRWDFYTEASNVDPVEEKTKPIDSSLAVTLEKPLEYSVPGFGLIPIISVGIVLLISRKKTSQ